MSHAPTTVAATRVEVAAVSLLACNVCHHTASRGRDPWDNQFRCAEGCRCTMQGCCPGKTAREAR